MATFCTVAYVKLEGCGEGRREANLTTLAVTFHTDGGITILFSVMVAQTSRVSMARQLPKQYKS